MVKNRAEFTAYFLIATAWSMEGHQILVSNTQQGHRIFEDHKDRALI